MFAYIPARIGSTRIFKKNIRLLDDKAIICHVIENLSKVEGLQGIAVSTDSPEVRDIVSVYTNVITLDLRDEEIANDSATFMDLVQQDLPRFQQYFKSDKVLFTLATSALISECYFQKAIHAFSEKDKHGNLPQLVMSVKSLTNEGLLALSLSQTGSISPLFPQNYGLPTASLPKLFSDAGGFYLFNAQQAKLHSMFIELQPIIPVLLPYNIGIDVDNEEDWQQLKQAYFMAKGMD